MLTDLRTLAVAALLMCPAAAAAHDWYHWNCCHDRDCRPLPEGSVVERGAGYVVTIPGREMPVLLKYGDPRIKLVPTEHDDGQTFHICTTAGAADTMVLCLYTPGRGV